MRPSDKIWSTKQKMKIRSFWISSFSSYQVGMQSKWSDYTEHSHNHFSALSLRQIIVRHSFLNRINTMTELSECTVFRVSSIRSSSTFRTILRMVLRNLLRILPMDLLPSVFSSRIRPMVLHRIRRPMGLLRIHLRMVHLKIFNSFETFTGPNSHPHWASTTARMAIRSTATRIEVGIMSQGVMINWLSHSTYIPLLATLFLVLRPVDSTGVEKTQTPCLTSSARFWPSALPVESSDLLFSLVCWPMTPAIPTFACQPFQIVLQSAVWVRIRQMTAAEIMTSLLLLRQTTVIHFLYVDSLMRSECDNRSDLCLCFCHQWNSLICRSHRKEVKHSTAKNERLRRKRHSFPEQPIRRNNN